ncbi:TrbC/VirB2 family protein [Hyphococcus sp.]|jgi:type IV secretory pathway VirB2 component (pilin)|uniref:TrbC/VirB2 family protein n=1 Tax=Hyphococcus sp. TaxID=2038636 RepID=UPI0035C749EF
MKLHSTFGLTIITVLAALFSSAAYAQTAVADPQGSGPIVAALDWLQGSLLGNVATTAAVIAVAAVGFMMLTGRLNWRYGITVVVGCFILFGATSIVAGIRAAAGG